MVLSNYLTNSQDFSMINQGFFFKFHDFSMISRACGNPVKSYPVIIFFVDQMSIYHEVGQGHP